MPSLSHGFPGSLINLFFVSFSNVLMICLCLCNICLYISHVIYILFTLIDIIMIVFSSALCQILCVCKFSEVFHHVV